MEALNIEVKYNKEKDHTVLSIFKGFLDIDGTVRKLPGVVLASAKVTVDGNYDPIIEGDAKMMEALKNKIGE